MTRGRLMLHLLLVSAFASRAQEPASPDEGVRSAADDIQSGAVRSGAMGESGQGRGHALRRVHDEASRRLHHVRYTAGGLWNHVAREVPMPMARSWSYVPNDQ